MKMFLSALVVGLLVAAQAEDAPNADIVVAEHAATAPLLSFDSSAADVLKTCRMMLPRQAVQLDGMLILRNRKGIVASRHDYRLVMRRTPEVAMWTISLMPHGSTNEETRVTISRRGESEPSINLSRAGAAGTDVVASPLERVLGTDVTWLDLTLDFLWWPDPSYESEREGESVHGQVCSVILVKPGKPIAGLSAVRLWVDKKTGCMMQAEQVDEAGKPIRRLWGTRVKKVKDRWIASVLEVETLGSRHRTKITIDEFKEL